MMVGGRRMKGKDKVLQYPLLHDPANDDDVVDDHQMKRDHHSAEDDE